MFGCFFSGRESRFDYRTKNLLTLEERTRCASNKRLCRCVTHEYVKLVSVSPLLHILFVRATVSSSLPHLFPSDCVAMVVDPKSSTCEMCLTCPLPQDANCTAVSLLERLRGCQRKTSRGSCKSLARCRLSFSGMLIPATSTHQPRAPGCPRRVRVGTTTRS